MIPPGSAVPPPAGDADAEIARADALRAGDAAARDEAVRIYCAHPDATAPDTPAGRARLVWLLRTGRARPDLHLAQVERGGEQTEDVAVRRTCRAALASILLRRAEHERGAAILTELLAEARGSDDLIEATSCLELVWSFRERKLEFEALVLARYAARRAARRGELWEECLALLYVGATQKDLGATDAAASTFGELGRRAAGLPPRRAAEIRAQMDAHGFDLAIARGDLTAARAHLARYAAAPAGPRVRDLRTKSIAEAEARLALAEDRPADALRVLDAVRSWNVPEDSAQFDVDVRRVAALGELGAPAFAPAVRDLLAHAASAGQRTLGTGRTMLLAAELAELATAHGAAADVVGDACELGARMAIARIFDLDRSLTHVVELRCAEGEDRAELAQYRAEFVARHRSFLVGLGAALRHPDATRRDVLDSMVHEDGVIHVCAWCLTARRRDGTEIAIGHLLQYAPRGQVTHGICRPCDISARRAAGLRPPPSQQ